MSRIQNYANDTNIEGGDKLFGTDTSTGTKNFVISDLVNYFNSSGILQPYGTTLTYETTDADFPDAQGTMKYISTGTTLDTVTGVQINRLTSSGLDITALVEDLGGSRIKIGSTLSQQNDYGVYTIFNVQFYPTYIELTLTQPIVQGNAINLGRVILFPVPVRADIDSILGTAGEIVITQDTANVNTISLDTAITSEVSKASPNEMNIFTNTNDIFNIHQKTDLINVTEAVDLNNIEYETIANKPIEPIRQVDNITLFGTRSNISTSAANEISTITMLDVFDPITLLTVTEVLPTNNNARVISKEYFPDPLVVGQGVRFVSLSGIRSGGREGVVYRDTGTHYEIYNVYTTTVGFRIEITPAPVAFVGVPVGGTTIPFQDIDAAFSTGTFSITGDVTSQISRDDVMTLAGGNVALFVYSTPTYDAVGNVTRIECRNIGRADYTSNVADSFVISAESAFGDELDAPIATYAYDPDTNNSVYTSSVPTTAFTNFDDTSTGSWNSATLVDNLGNITGDPDFFAAASSVDLSQSYVFYDGTIEFSGLSTSGTDTVTFTTAFVAANGTSYTPQSFFNIAGSGYFAAGGTGSWRLIRLTTINDYLTQVATAITGLESAITWDGIVTSGTPQLQQFTYDFTDDRWENAKTADNVRGGQLVEFTDSATNDITYGVMTTSFGTQGIFRTLGIDTSLTGSFRQTTGDPMYLGQSNTAPTIPALGTGTVSISGDVSSTATVGYSLSMGTSNFSVSSPVTQAMLINSVVFDGTNTLIGVTSITDTDINLNTFNSHFWYSTNALQNQMGTTLTPNSISIDLGTTTNVSSSYVIQGGEFNAETLVNTDGVGGPVATTVTVRDGNNMEVTSFTSTVTSSTESDVDTIGSRIATAITTNTETPIDFSATYDSSTKIINIVARSAGPHDDWSITINNNGATPENAGDISASAVSSADIVANELPIISFTDNTSQTTAFPSPPETGTATLQSVDGVLSWITT